MKAFVFIGPTIAEAEARQWLDAEYLPPVAQGDVVSLLRYQPDVIAIIDGYFNQVPSVWHKEILLALSQGVTVLGASSMGALRAAELHPFGMLGVGRIFEWYREGVIDADDEVAIRHAPAEFGYQAVSEAMVNIRSTLEAAQHAGLISETTHQRLIAIGRDMHYGNRSYRTLLAAASQAGLPGGQLDALKDFVASNRVDQKKEDAITLLRHVASLRTDERPATANFDLHRTVYLERMLDLDQSVVAPGAARVTLHELVDFARLEEPSFREMMEKAGQRRMLVELARRFGLSVNGQEKARAWDAFREQMALTQESEAQEWMFRNGVTESELSSFIEELALERKAQSMFSHARNRDLLWQLRLEGRFEALTAALRERNQQEAGLEAAEVSTQELLDFYKRKTGHAQAATLDDAMRKLGFGTKASLMIELQRAHRHAQGARQEGA